MPPFLSLFGNHTNNTLALTTFSTSANCPTNGGVKIALAVISILLAVSEFLSLNKRIPAAGILHGVVMAIHKPSVKREEGGMETELSEQQPENDKVVPDTPTSEDQEKIESMVSHAREGLAKLSIKV